MIDDRTLFRVLVDADALVALAKNDDVHHARAQEIHSKLLRRAAVFSISPTTIPEAATVLSYKVGQHAAMQFLRAARATSFDVLECTTKIWAAADVWFLKQKRKGTSYFDCLNMALMEQYQLDSIFSFDAVYRKNRFSVA